MAMIRRRIACWIDTKEISDRFHPKPPASVKIKIPEAEYGLAPTYVDVSVEEMDSIDCALSYKQQGFNPVVLNLADDRAPGGCVDMGSGAQEESLFMRTNLCETLKSRHYPIGDDELIYSRGVTVFKSREPFWKLLSPFETLAFITCPGLRYPSIDAETETLFTKDEARLRLKIKNILNVAMQYGHDVPVLGALGCGAWRNPNGHVARIFADVLKDDRYALVFKKVVFAIIPAPQGETCRQNLPVFRNVFKDWNASQKSS